jgi:hypothetical protein
VLLQVAPTEFILHLKAVQPGVTQTDAWKTSAYNFNHLSISEAGRGPGLQVFFNTIPWVDCVSFNLQVAS